MFELIGKVVTVIIGVFGLLWIVPPLCGYILKWNRSRGLNNKHGLVQQKILPLSQQTILITGGSGEVGVCLSRRFAMEGVKNLIIWDINPLSLQSFAAELKENYGFTPILMFTPVFEPQSNLSSSLFESERELVSNPLWSSVCSNSDSSTPLLEITPTSRYCICIYQDLAQTEHIESAFNKASTMLQIASPHVLINNAGVVYPAGMFTSPSAILENTLKVNAIAPVVLIKTFISAITSQIATSSQLTSSSSLSITSLPAQYQYVTVASAAGYSYAVGLGPYCGSKAALIALHKSARMELARVATEGAVRIANGRTALFPSIPSFSKEPQSSSRGILPTCAQCDGDGYSYQIQHAQCPDCLFPRMDSPLETPLPAVLDNKNIILRWFHCSWFYPFLWLFSVVKTFCLGSSSAREQIQLSKNYQNDVSRLVAQSIRTVLVTPWRIQTRMFDGVIAHPLVNLLFPPLHPDTQVRLFSLIS